MAMNLVGNRVKSGGHESHINLCFFHASSMGISQMGDPPKRWFSLWCPKSVPSKNGTHPICLPLAEQSDLHLPAPVPGGGRSAAARFWRPSFGRCGGPGTARWRRRCQRVTCGRPKVGGAQILTHTSCVLLLVGAKG